MTRPVCANCGRPYGERRYVTQTDVVEIGQPIPPAKSNLRLVRMRCFPELPGKGGPATPEKAMGYVPMDRRDSMNMLTRMAVAYTGRRGRRIERSYWDGKSYWSDNDPFCTGRCAAEFAQVAYKAGYRRQP